MQHISIKKYLKKKYVYVNVYLAYYSICYGIYMRITQRIGFDENEKFKVDIFFF